MPRWRAASANRLASSWSLRFSSANRKASFFSSASRSFRRCSSACMQFASMHRQEEICIKILELRVQHFKRDLVNKLQPISDCSSTHSHVFAWPVRSNLSSICASTLIRCHQILQETRRRAALEATMYKYIRSHLAKQLLLPPVLDVLQLQHSSGGTQVLVMFNTTQPSAEIRKPLNFENPTLAGAIVTGLQL